MSRVFTTSERFGPWKREVCRENQSFSIVLTEKENESLIEKIGPEAVHQINRERLGVVTCRKCLERGKTMSKNEITPQVGDIWRWDEYSVTSPINAIAENEVSWIEQGHFCSVYKDCLLELIERDGKRGNDLWQAYKYRYYPQAHKDALQAHWDDGKVIESWTPSLGWTKSIWLHSGNGFCLDSQYRMVERSRVETEEPNAYIIGEEG